MEIARARYKHRQSRNDSPKEYLKCDKKARVRMIKDLGRHTT